MSTLFGCGTFWSALDSGRGSAWAGAQSDVHFILRKVDCQELNNNGAIGPAGYWELRSQGCAMKA